jgi:hypothetical protein
LFPKPRADEEEQSICFGQEQFLHPAPATRHNDYNWGPSKVLIGVAHTSLHQNPLTPFIEFLEWDAGICILKLKLHVLYFKVSRSSCSLFPLSATSTNIVSDPHSLLLRFQAQRIYNSINFVLLLGKRRNSMMFQCRYITGDSVLYLKY